MNDNNFLSSKTNRKDLRPGTYSVMDAWDKKPSHFTVTIDDNQNVVDVKSSNQGTSVSVDDVNRYLNQGFDLLGAVAAGAKSGDDTDVGNEDQLGLGEPPYDTASYNAEPQQYSESMTLNKQFIYNITESNYSEANKTLEKLLEAKLKSRIRTSLQRVDEGLFDRLGARASGLGAGLKSKAQNFATRAGSAAKAMGQNIGGAVTGKGFSAGQETVNAANKKIAANDPRKNAKKAQADNIIASFTKDLSKLYPDVNVQKAMQNLRTQLNLTKVK